MINIFDESTANILQDAINNGIISLDDVTDIMTKKEKENIITSHPYEIWLGKDNRWRTYIIDATTTNKRRLIVKTHREALVNYLVQYYKKQDREKQLTNITLEKLYPKWLEYKRLHTTADNYIQRINRDWKSYYLDTEIITIPIKNLTKLTLDTWTHDLIRKHKMSKTNYYNATIIMRQALEYAVDLGVISINPFSLVKIDGKKLFRKIRKKADNTQVFLKYELDQLFELAWNDFYTNNKLRHKLAPLALLFQFQTGIRIGELCSIKYQDIEKSDYIHIQRMYRYETKEVVDHAKTAESDRLVFLTSKAKEIIKIAHQYQTDKKLNTNGYIFSVNENPLSHVSVANLYRKYCDQIGTVRKSSHKSRKTYISSLIDGNVNINTIRKMCGHTDERTTYNSYCFDRNSDDEKAIMIQNALN